MILLPARNVSAFAGSGPNTRIDLLAVMVGLNNRVYISPEDRYTALVTKRLVEIDDELLKRARAAAGTNTIKATVETALRRLVDRDTALQHVARLRTKGALDMTLLDEARRPRTGTRG